MPGKFWELLRNNLLVLLTVLAVVIGTVLGIILQKANPSEDVLLWVGMPGEIFIRLLKLTIIPLIVATVIIVTSTLNLKENGKISAVALVFITTSNVVAAICGTVASLLLKPGFIMRINELSTHCQNVCPNHSSISSGTN